MSNIVIIIKVPSKHSLICLYCIYMYVYVQYFAVFYTVEFLLTDNV